MFNDEINRKSYSHVIPAIIIIMAESASGQYEVNINLKIVKSILFKRVLTLKKAALPKRRLKLF